MTTRLCVVVIVVKQGKKTIISRTVSSTMIIEALCISHMDDVRLRALVYNTFLGTRAMMMKIDDFLIL